MMKIFDRFTNKWFWRRVEKESQGVRLDKEDMEIVYYQMSLIQELPQAFRTLMASDIRSYFQAKTEKERDTLRGAYLRTLYFLKQTKVAKEPIKARTSTPKVGGRYG